jgi:hypothetical protein
MDITPGLGTGDNIYIILPSQFELVDNGMIQATLNDIPVKTIVYETIN